MSIEDPPPRLKSRLWVQSALRSCIAAGITATIAKRGDADAGSVLIKQNFLGDGFCVLSPTRAADGELAWTAGTGPDTVTEEVADGYIARQVNRDSDLWVIEIEERTGALPFPHRRA